MVSVVKLMNIKGFSARNEEVGPTSNVSHINYTVSKRDTWFLTLFHRLTRTAYLYNGCLPWYNVVLTSRVHSSVKYSQQ